MYTLTNVKSHTMEQSIGIQVELSEISLMFNQFIVNLERKLARNKMRVSVTQDDLNELTDIQIKLKSIAKKDVTELRQTVVEEKEQLQQELAHKNGQLSTITNMLQLCYNDYKSTGREDALKAIEGAVTEAQIN